MCSPCYRMEDTISSFSWLIALCNENTSQKGFSLGSWLVSFRVFICSKGCPNTRDMVEGIQAYSGDQDHHEGVGERWAPVPCCFDLPQSQVNALTSAFIKLLSPIKLGISLFQTNSKLSLEKLQMPDPKGTGAKGFPGMRAQPMQGELYQLLFPVCPLYQPTPFFLQEKKSHNLLKSPPFSCQWLSICLSFHLNCGARKGQILGVGK